MSTSKLEKEIEEEEDDDEDGDGDEEDDEEEEEDDDDDDREITEEELKEMLEKEGITLEEFRQMEEEEEEEEFGFAMPVDASGGNFPPYLFMTPAQRKKYFGNLNTTYYKHLAEEKIKKLSHNRQVKFNAKGNKTHGKSFNFFII